MKIRDHGNGVAIALAGLAVVLATTGTAYAVTVTTVNIADPANPSRVAKVDPGGRLSTVGAGSSIAVSSGITFDTTFAMTSPTVATLAISSLSFSNPPLNSQFSGTSYQVSLVKITAGTAGSCATGAAGVGLERILGQVYLDPGDDITTAYPAPLIVKATGTAKYCLGLSYFHIGGGAQTSLYSSTVQLTGFVSSGSYTGAGLGAAPDAAAPAAPTVLTR